MTQISPAQLSMRVVLLPGRTQGLVHTPMAKSRNGNRRQEHERKYIPAFMGITGYRIP